MSIELSNQQIENLFAFVKEKYVRYIDVQYELVDHLATAIEEEMNQDDQLSFEAALKEVYARFPITGFDKFLREKEKAMISYWRRKIGSIIMQYLSLPKLVMTMMLLVLYGTLTSIHSKWSLGLCFTLCIAALIYSLFFINNGSNNSTSNYLVLQKFNQISGGGTLALLPLCFANVLPSFNSLSPLMFTSWQFYLVTLFCTISTVLVHASIFEFPKIIKQEIDNKYAHLNIKLA